MIGSVPAGDAEGDSEAISFTLSCRKRKAVGRLFKHLDKYLNNEEAIKKIFHQKAFARYVLATKKRCLAIRACVCAVSVAILLANRTYLMQNLFTAHSLKMGLRLVVVVLLSFILVNLLS